MKVVLNKLLSYKPAAEVSMPSVRMQKWKWLLFIYISPMTCYAFQLVGLISSYTFNFDGLTRSRVY